MVLSDAISLGVGLLFMLTGSWMLPTLTDWVGDKFDIPQGLLGIIVALAADAPEITSGIAAIVSGSRDVGVSVILGSNIFNLAVLLGLGALVASEVRVWRRPLFLHGTVSVLVTLVAAGLIAGELHAFVSIVLLAAIVIPYIVILAMPPLKIKQLPVPQPVAAGLAASVRASQTQEEVNAQQRREEEERPPRLSTWAPTTLLVGSLFAVVGGSTAMVNGVLGFAHLYNLPSRDMGTLVLATLTGIPNVYTAVLLAQKGRGRAVLSETLNSNTVNIFVGIGLPAIFVGLAVSSRRTYLDLWWLLAMTALAMLLGGRKGVFSRLSGSVLLAGYGGFVAVTVLGVQ